MASVALAEEMRRSEFVSRTVLPPLTIREPASGSTALDRRFKQREVEIAKGKGKEKFVEYVDIFHAYGDGEDFNSEQASIIMIRNNESVMHHQDEQFENVRSYELTI